MFAAKDELFTRPSGGYTIARSVRLRSSASAYLSRTLTTPTSNTTWTLSLWIKRGALSTNQGIISAGTSAIEYVTSTDTLRFYSAGPATAATSTAVYRDPAAWGHLVITSNGTTVVAYFNSVSVLSYTGTLPQFNSAISHSIGRYAGGGDQFDGYLTEINFIDGQALTPSSFGETDSSTGVWKPKAFSGIYGTNGFELNFSDNSASTAATIGKDYSGNGNNWTPNNISVTAGVTYDSMTDVPTLTSATAANYATLNPLAVGSSGTLSDGSLKIAGVNSANVGASYSTIGMTTGKWYFEVTAVGVGSNFSYALVEDVVDTSALNVSGSIFAGYRSTGDTYGTVSITTTTWNTANVVIGVAVDCDNGAVYFANANTWINSGVPTSGASRTGAITTYTAGTKTLHGGVGCYQDSTQSAAINFGQRPFSYTPPTGFVALNTYNLPDSTIKNGAGYMAATTYTGTGASLTVANTVGSTSFQPDWVWVKGRSGATSHALYDSVRGTTKDLVSDSTAAETTQTTGLTAFGSTGFTVGALAKMNTSAATYVAWQWLASGTSASNTNGSITSTVSVGATQGFSVVTYTGTGVTATVGHGLGVAPSFMIVRKRNGTEDWPVYHVSLGNTQKIFLDLTNASATDSTMWNNTTPTSSVFSIGTNAGTNNVGYNFVAYCFSAVAGYSAFGSYTGNGSADGVFVYLGFRPRFMMWKRTDTTADWYMWDTTRDTYNGGGQALWPNYNLAETNYGTGTSGLWDILSNGFKLRTNSVGMNTNGANMIYMAFAENPLKYALAR